ncbi:Zinc finger BED domain-containing protein RICESLEEPER 4 [Bienertia sinuspersici]
MENFYEPDFDPDGPPLQEEQQLENVGSTTSRSVTIDMPHARSVTIDAPHAESQPAKKCKLVDPTKEWKRRSPFWDHYSFSTVKGKDGKLVRYATCIHCHVAKYKADPKYGTSNAKKHLDQCDAYQDILLLTLSLLLNLIKKYFVECLLMLLCTILILCQ